MAVLVLLPFAATSDPAVDKSGLDYVDPEPLTRPLDGVAQLSALKRAYPGRISAMEYRNGDWAILVNGEWIYWANGRLLPRKARHHWYLFSRFAFYPYSGGPLHIPRLNEQEEVRLQAVLQAREENPPLRHNAFPGALYGFRTAGEARRTMVVVSFLGHTVRVHPMIRESLDRVQGEIEEAAAGNEEVRSFLRELLRVEAFYWRPIAGTRTVSYHGYGVAVDLIPRSYYRRSAYWRWSEEAGIEDWWNIPLERRWTIPQPIVEIFERHGFVWGGRWLFFDAIHFEYRPELFLLEATGFTDTP
ncbi:MAG: M15 family peptidase [Spirochaetaceae bacterium]|nr:MAG: M15 family peptidase [Spirochaetaceae bacterium]